MAMLYPCPRCTQALPSTASFCRRCGAAVQLLQPTAQAGRKGKRTSPSPFFFPLFIAGIIGAGVMFWRMSAMPSADQTNVPMQVAPQYQVPLQTPLQTPVYRPPLQVVPFVPRYVPPMVEPVYPDRSDGRYHEYHGDMHHQGR
jgi:ribosomal protein L40E